MKIILIIIIVFLIKLWIDKRKNKKHGIRFLINRFLLISFIIGSVYIFSGWMMYDVVTADIEDEFEKAFDTPLEKISDLEGYGGGFQDFYLQLCFISSENVILKDAEKYLSLEDSSLKSGIIKEFKKSFNSEEYDEYRSAFNDIKLKNVEIKEFLDKGESYNNSKILLNIKNKGIYFFINR